jgi:hypothetical protein
MAIASRPDVFFFSLFMGWAASDVTKIETLAQERR